MKNKMAEPETTNQSPEEGPETRKKGGLLSLFFGPKKEGPVQDRTLEIPATPAPYSPPLEQMVSADNAPVPEKKAEPEPPSLGEYKPTLDYLKDKLLSLHGLETQITRYEKEIADYKAKLSIVETESSKAKDLYETLHVKYVKKESEVEALHQRLGKHEWDLKEADKKTQEFLRCQQAYQESIESYKNKIGEYEHISAGLEGIISDLKTENAEKMKTLRTALDDKDQQITTYTCKISEFQSKEADYVGQITSGKIAYAELEARLKKMEEKHKQVTSLLKPEED